MWFLIEWVPFLRKSIEVLVFVRLESISHFQELFLEALLRPNVHSIALKVLNLDLNFILHLRHCSVDVDGVLLIFANINIIQLNTLAHDLCDFICLCNVFSDAFHLFLQHLLLLTVCNLFLVFGLHFKLYFPSPFLLLFYLFYHSFIFNL